VSVISEKPPWLKVCAPLQVTAPEIVCAAKPPEKIAGPAESNPNPNLNAPPLVLSISPTSSDVDEVNHLRNSTPSPLGSIITLGAPNATKQKSERTTAPNINLILPIF